MLYVHEIMRHLDKVDSLFSRVIISNTREHGFQVREIKLK